MRSTPGGVSVTKADRARPALVGQLSPRAPYTPTSQNNRGGNGFTHPCIGDTSRDVLCTTPRCSICDVLVSRARFLGYHRARLFFTPTVDSCAGWAGAIPSELGRLSNLVQLRLDNNRLSGELNLLAVTPCFGSSRDKTAFVSVHSAHEMLAGCYIQLFLFL